MKIFINLLDILQGNHFNFNFYFQFRLLSNFFKKNKRKSEDGSDLEPIPLDNENILLRGCVLRFFSFLFFLFFSFTFFFF